MINMVSEEQQLQQGKFQEMGLWREN